jgi:excinuclease ABC subunit A
VAKRATGRTIYILDEPTTGLHFEDIRHLIGVLQRLVDTGNTVLVIEHNLDVIKTADWIVDLGPEGGDGGGRVVAEGPPEVVAKVPESHTGRFLAEILGIDPPPAAKSSTVKGKPPTRTAAATAAPARTTPVTARPKRRPKTPPGSRPGA